LEELGLGGIFDFPKSVQLVKKLLKYTEDGQIVLDFFGGSGTTAEAIMEMNKDGNRRKFILAQLPEKCDESGEAYKAGYKTISQFTIERIKRAALKVQKEMESSDEGLSDRQANKGMDVGIKVFRLSPSNFKIWRGDEVTNANLGTQLDAFTDPVREGSENRNMIYELLLKAGYDLTEEIELKQGYASVHAAELIIAIEDMSPEIIEKIILARPKKVITLDKLFSGNDQLKTNTVLQMKDAGIDFKTI
ncbi:MAG TPA: DNA methyltransferase, partial [Bacteroidia bacterium]|nr:DNA methyltransferase [Bacteroidia bacterium]